MDTLKFRAVRICSLVLLAWVFSCTPNPESEQTPNILFIAIDDMNDNELKKYLPKSEAALILKGKALHNVVDADQPSLEKFKELWNKMQKRGMGLE